MQEAQDSVVFHVTLCSKLSRPTLFIDGRLIEPTKFQCGATEILLVWDIAQISQVSTFR